MEYINIVENGIHIVFGVTEKRQLKLLHFQRMRFGRRTCVKLARSARRRTR